MFGGNNERDQLKLHAEGLENQIRDVERRADELEERARRLMGDECAAVATKWEYIVEDDASEGKLDERGRRGWELVSVTCYVTGWGIGSNEKKTDHFRYTFKRPLLASYSSEVEALIESSRATRLSAIDLQRELDQTRYQLR